MAKTLEEFFPHKFGVGDTVKVVARGESEWCKIGDTHKVRVCRHDHEDGAVYVVDDDDESAYIRECNLELVERDRQKGGEWKRHRGGKCPVSENSVIDVKLDTGDTMKNEVAGNWAWSHQDIYPRIMQYRVISQPQAEEVEVNVFVGKDVKIEYAYAQEGVEPEHLEWKTMGTAKIDSICDLGSTEAKTDQIDGPIKWRDTVTELNAYIEKFTRERDELINRLASEGFALIPAMTPVMGVADIDFSDWRNWKAGDIVECTHSGFDKVYTEGKSYCVDHVTNEYAKVADDCGENSFCHINNDEDVKFRLVR